MLEGLSTDDSEAADNSDKDLLNETGRGSDGGGVVAGGVVLSEHMETFHSSGADTAVPGKKGDGTFQYYPQY